MSETQIHPFPDATHTSTAHLPAQTVPRFSSQSTAVTTTLNNSAGCSPHWARLGPHDNPHCSASPGPLWRCSLPGFREPCLKGGSSMGARSMPSLPSAKPLASSPRQRQSETPPNRRQPQVQVGPRGLRAKQLLRGAPYSHAAHKRSQRPSRKGRSQQPVTPRGEASPWLPLALQVRGRHGSLHSCDGQAVGRPRTTDHAGLLSGPEPGRPCKVPDWGWGELARSKGGGPGKRRGWILAVP